MRHEYSPGKIEQLLPHLAYLPLRGAYLHPDDTQPGSHLIHPAEWLEDRIVERSDLTRALSLIDWQLRYALFFTYIPSGMTRDQMRTVESWETRTIEKRCGAGLHAMARALGWTPPERTQRAASPTDWRHPSLEAAGA